MAEKKTKGSLVISLDAEIAWGRIAASERDYYYSLFENTREVIQRLLSLFDQYDTPVTWAVVGRLVDNQEYDSDDVTMDIAIWFPQICSASIYSDDVLNRKGNSYIRYSELIDDIRNAKVSHEIGSHTFSHIFFEEIESEALVEKDFQSMRDLQRRLGLTSSSFVFPKNQVRYLHLLEKYGYDSYRAPDRFWYSGLPKPLVKVVRQIDNLLPTPVATVECTVVRDRLVEIPGSILFRREHIGFRRHFPVSILARKTNRALRIAASTGRVVHLWFHPFNFAYRSKAHFAALESVLIEANRLREGGTIDILTMKQQASREFARNT